MIELARHINFCFFVGWLILLEMFLAANILNWRQDLKEIGYFTRNFYAPAFIVGEFVALLLWAWER